MKSGHFIVLGIATWVSLNFFNSLWVFQTNAHLIAAGLIGLSSIIWLTDKSNRENLLSAISFKGLKVGKDFADNLLNVIKVGLISIFSILTVGFEIAKFSIRQSEAYDFIKREITKDKEIKDRIGEIDYLGVGNNFSGKFNDSKKGLRASFIIFGSSGQVNADIKVTKTDKWTIEKIEIED